MPLPHQGVSCPGVSFFHIWHLSPSFPPSPCQWAGGGSLRLGRGKTSEVALGDLTDGLLAWGWEFPAASGPFPAHLRVPDPISPFPASPCSPPRSQLWPPPPAAAGLSSSPQLTHPLYLFGGSSFQIVGNWDHASSWLDGLRFWLHKSWPQWPLSLHRLFSLSCLPSCDPWARRTETSELPEDRPVSSLPWDVQGLLPNDLSHLDR